ncbi:YpsA SLOG family protein [Desulfococcus sp.]|uniref:YpsA SLOG family protein n=1 Tax=Desulfococcus sp. TaxID=2025834 RepID=UPI003D0DFC4C
MIRKVISGGEAGVERAALDAAQKFMIDCGGWMPRRRDGEDEALVRAYRLTLLIDADADQAAARNVSNADGVLAIVWGAATESAARHLRLAERYGRPAKVLDLDRIPAFKAAREAEAWIREKGIAVLNVTGSQTTDAAVYRTASDILETLHQLLMIDPRHHRSGPGDVATRADVRLDAFVRIPKTVDEAVAVLLSALSFRDRTRIANMDEKRLDTLMPSIGVYIQNEFRLRQGNPSLMDDCRARSDTPDEAPAKVVIRALRHALRNTDGVLRVVK